VPRNSLPLPKVRQAAVYVRMSTEHQQYSIANQLVAIEKYADQNKLMIAKRFLDSGRSGLTLSGRPGLRQLLLEVISGKAEFSDVLVYDVSRWGRFQDADESAYYEYTCKKANVKVHYCAEQFENDGSPYSTLIKTLKRAMAGEFSRELSTKVFAGQARLAQLGYRLGGSPGYGLRRQLLDSEGRVKGILRFGERKGLQSDRVILIPGPERELAVIREIFDLFTTERKSEREIVDILNLRKIRLEPGRRWTRVRVHQILTDPKYMGTSAFNRRSRKLHQKTVKNLVENWILRDGAFTSIISREQYSLAQRIVRLRGNPWTDDHILDQLRWLLNRVGRLTGVIINEDRAAPSVATIQHRFGSLHEAYKLIGYNPDRIWTDDQMLDQLRWLLKKAGRLTPMIISEELTAPSVATIQDRFGSVREAYRLIGYKPNRVCRIKPLIEEVRDAVKTGRLSNDFDVQAIRKACPGWAVSTYASTCVHYAISGERLVRVSRGRYRSKD
jgi:DNA invertase Pin-like site-specific DNA recombinase